MTLRDDIDARAGDGSVDAARWLLRRQPSRPGSPRLVCIPHAGGDTAVFRSWLTLDPPFDVVAVRLPGRGARIREPCVTSAESMAEQIAAAIRVDGDGPVSLFGHSMGGLIAFEVARRLERADRLVSHLVLSACASPKDVPDREPLHTLPTSEFIAALRRFGGTPAAVLDNSELLALLVPTLRADLQLCEAYVPDPTRPPLQCRVTVLAGCSDRLAPPDKAADWAKYTCGPFSVEVIEAGHFFITSHEDKLHTIMLRHSVPQHG